MSTAERRRADEPVEGDCKDATVERAARRLVSLGWGLYSHLERAGVGAGDLRALGEELEALSRLADSVSLPGRRDVPVIPGQMSIYDLGPTA